MKLAGVPKFPRFSKSGNKIANLATLATRTPRDKAEISESAFGNAFGKQAAHVSHEALKNSIAVQRVKVLLVLQRA